MPNKPLHICNKPGCNNLTRERYCDEHIREKNRYNYERTDKMYTDFYKTSEWICARSLAMIRDHYQCVMCRRKGIVTLASMVHHIVPIKKDWNRRLDLNNLMSLCDECHNGIKH